MKFFPEHRINPTITNITHKYNIAKTVQDMNFPYVGYCKNNW